MRTCQRDQGAALARAVDRAQRRALLGVAARDRSDRWRRIVHERDARREERADADDDLLREADARGQLARELRARRRFVVLHVRTGHAAD